MQYYMRLAAFYAAGINLLAFALFGLDKLLARKKRRRIPESTLLTLCFLLGSLGGALGMALFRHKINGRKHPAFAYGVPALLVIHLGLWAFCIARWGMG